MRAGCVRANGEDNLHIICATCEHNPEFIEELYEKEGIETKLDEYFLQLLEFKSLIDSGISIQNYLTYEQWQELAIINLEIEKQKVKNIPKRKTWQKPKSVQ